MEVESAMSAYHQDVTVLMPLRGVEGINPGEMQLIHHQR